MRSFKGWLHPKDDPYGNVFGWLEGDTIYDFIKGIREPKERGSIYILTEGQLNALLNSYRGKKDSREYEIQSVQKAIQHIKDKKETDVVFQVEIPS